MAFEGITDVELKAELTRRETIEREKAQIAAVAKYKERKANADLKLKRKLEYLFKVENLDRDVIDDVIDAVEDYHDNSY